MATQSLYRRYRPRRFSELKGQDHVVRALRDAVRSGREGQAYLFSGPRGTGKTTSARILAKVLNCEHPVDGEPCCECESCLSVERGTSYDVHELDAASNNGVDAIRDLIEKAALGTPGRHKVYILDEVHMLSKAAEAALLKTLEEPPPHVVFVLATTDPQKMSDTIRSRTQHLQFHLLPADTLAEHVRWVAADAGLELTDAAFDAALSQGGGSARDTLSALELLASTGGDVLDAIDLDEFVQAMVDRDPGTALTAMANAIALGRDPRTLAEELIRHLRNGFLSLMAPDLVPLPADRVAAVAARAGALGAAGLVRAIERLGTALVDMRHAPDPRILVEVALVQLTHDSAGGDLAALTARLERLEQAVKSGAVGGSGGGGASVVANAGGGGAAAAPAPVDPSTGRAVLGGRARREAPAPSPSPADPPAGTAGAAGRAPGADGAQASTPGGGDSPTSASAPAEPASATAPPTSDSTATAPTETPADTADSGRSAAEVHPSTAPAASEGRIDRANESTPTTPANAGASRAAAEAAPRPAAPRSTTTPTTESTVAAAGASTHEADRSSAGTASGSAGVDVPTIWESTVRAGLKPLVKALYHAGAFVGQEGDAWRFSVPNETHRAKCEEHRAAVEIALGAAAGAPIRIMLVVGHDPVGDDDAGLASSSRAGSGAGRPDATGAAGSPAAAGAATAANGVGLADVGRTDDPDEDIDLDDLVDAPPESALSTIDRLAQAFPGSELVDDVD
jgi:DNA polymerase-3 subunit gamma/tau